MDHSRSVNRPDSACMAPLDPASWLPNGADASTSPAVQSFRLLQSLQERARMTRTSQPAPMSTFPPPSESIECMSPQLLHNYSRSAQPVSATNEWNAVAQEHLYRSLLTQHLIQQTTLPPRFSSAPWGMPGVSPLNYWSANTLPSMTTWPTFLPSPPLDHAASPSFGEVANLFPANISNQTFSPSTNFPPNPYLPTHGDGTFNAFTDRRVSPCNSPFSSPAQSPLRSPSILSPANRSPVGSPPPSRSQSLTRDLSAVRLEGEGAISGPNITPPRFLGTPVTNPPLLPSLFRFLLIRVGPWLGLRTAPR